MQKKLLFILAISIIITSTPLIIYAQEIYVAFVITIHKFDTPTAVITDSNDRIYFSEFGSTIDIYDRNGNFIKEFSTAPALITAMTIDSNERIIGLDIFTQYIHIYDLDGNLLNEFTYDHFNTAGSVTTDSANRIIVSDFTEENIVIFDSDGIFIQNVTHANFDHPTGIATDSTDRIIVADNGSDNVFIFDSDGIFIKDFTGTTFTNPHMVAIDSEDRIIIGDSDLSTHQTDYEGVHVFNSDGIFEFLINEPLIQMGQIHSVTTDSLDRIIILDGQKNIISVVDHLGKTNGIQGNSGDCSGDCKPPSLESFEFNDTSNWLTAKNQTFNIGDKQVMKFVYHENEGIDDINDVEIGFGLPYLGSPIHKAEIKLKINTNNEIFESLEIDDENKLFLENSTTVNIDQVQCGYFECLEYTLEFVWAEIPFDGYFLITASDDHNNTTYDRNEEPFTVIGETLNEEPTFNIYNRYTSSLQDGLFINLTRIDKVADIWIDDKGEYWHGLGNDQFELVR